MVNSHLIGRQGKIVYSFVKLFLAKCFLRRSVLCSQYKYFCEIIHFFLKNSRKLATPFWSIKSKTVHLPKAVSFHTTTKITNRHTSTAPRENWLSVDIVFNCSAVHVSFLIFLYWGDKIQLEGTPPDWIIWRNKGCDWLMKMIAP